MTVMKRFLAALQAGFVLYAVTTSGVGYRLDRG
jgi:hypothetical protein